MAAPGRNGISGHLTWRNAAIAFGALVVAAVPLSFLWLERQSASYLQRYETRAKNLEERFAAVHKENLALAMRIRDQLEAAQKKFQRDVADAGHAISRAILDDFRREIEVVERLLAEHRKIDVHAGAVTQRELVLIRSRFDRIEQQLDTLMHRLMSQSGSRSLGGNLARRSTTANAAGNPP